MSNKSSVSGEEVSEYSPLHRSVSLSKLVDCQGQPIDTCGSMESSFMEFLESVRIRAVESGTDIGHIQDSIVELVQSVDEYHQVKQLVSELMERNQNLDSSLLEARDARQDYETRARQLEHELHLMRDQLEVVMRDANETNELLDWKSGREKQLMENQKNATKYQLGLEQENRQLVDESRALREEAVGTGLRERELIGQCFDQLGSANRRIEVLNMESHQRESANSALEGRLQELSDTVKQMQEHQKILFEENTQLKQHLYCTYETQHRVAGHVQQLQSVNEEYSAMLGDTQSQLHELRARTDLISAPSIPLSSELQSAMLYPTQHTQDNITGTKQHIVPVTTLRPSAPTYPSPRDSSDSDSFICISDPKKKLSQSERVRSHQSHLPKSKSVTFLGLSDTESTDEGPYRPSRSKQEQIPGPVFSIMRGSYSPELKPKLFGNRKLLAQHDNVKLVKNVKGSVHLEKWRHLASSKNELLDSGSGIRRKSKQKQFGGSMEDISSFFNDSSKHQESQESTTIKRRPSPEMKTKQDSKSHTGIINNLTETIGFLWKWNN